MRETEAALTRSLNTEIASPCTTIKGDLCVSAV